MAHTAADTDTKNFRRLIADDSAFARKNIATVLERLGGSVVGEAANGLEAIDLYERLRLDLVLLDITMPELDGVEALRRIMEQDKNARVIIVSSVGHQEMLWRAICLGAKSFVTKPYNPEYAGLVIKDVVAGGTGSGTSRRRTRREQREAVRSRHRARLRRNRRPPRNPPPSRTVKL